MTMWTRGRAYALARRPDKAADELVRAVATSTANQRAIHDLAGVYLQLGQFEAVISLWKKMGYPKNDIHLLLHVGNAHLKLGKADEAFSIYHLLVEHITRAKGVWLNLGLAAESQKRFATAACAYRQAAEIGVTYARAWERLARVEFRRGNKRYAELAIEQALRIKPNDPMLLGLNGKIIALAGGNPTEAEASVRRGLAFQPRNPFLYENLGDTLVLTKGDKKQVIEAYSRAIELLSTMDSSNALHRIQDKLLTASASSLTNDSPVDVEQASPED